MQQQQSKQKNKQKGIALQFNYMHQFKSGDNHISINECGLIMHLWKQEILVILL